MKIDRIISIIMILLERKKISASKLAEMFEVTPRTIYRDIDTINSAGIPIITYPGVNGGIGIMEQYKIEKKLFSISDITTLLIGLGSIPSTMSNEEVLNTIAKIKGILPEEHVSDIELRSNQITIDYTPWYGNSRIQPNIELIKRALNERLYISFNYLDQKGKKSQRKVEPYRLLLKDSKWYLEGYCAKKCDFRFFKLSRMTSLEITEEKFTPREFEQKWSGANESLEKKIVQIKLLVDESLQDWMADFCGEENIEPYENNKLIVKFPLIEDDFGYSFLLRFGDRCECLEPEHVRMEVVRRVENLLAVYKKEKS